MSKQTNHPIVHPIIVETRSSLLSVNFYLVQTEQSLFLVDAGLPTEKCWHQLNDVLQKNGWKIEDIQKNILTHNHHDHIGLVNRIRSHHHIPVYAHRDAVVRLQREPSFFNRRIDFFQALYSKMGCGKDGEKEVERLRKATIKNKDDVLHGEISLLQEGDCLDGLQVVEVPGHAADHISLFHEGSGQLLAGDHLLQHISSNALIEPDAQGQMIPSLQLYETSLKKCLKLPMTVIYPGHGEVITSPHELIKKRIDELDRKSAKIKRVVAEQARTAAEVAQIYYPNKYKTEFSLVMSEIMGHLNRLQSLEQISSEERGHIIYYRADDSFS